MASTSTLTACTFPLIETLQALSRLLQSLLRALQSVLRPLETLSRPLQSFSRPIQALSSLEIFFFGTLTDTTSSLTAFISTLTVSSSTLTASKNARYCIYAKVSLSHILFLVKIFVLSIIFRIFCIFFIVFKKIL